MEINDIAPDDHVNTLSRMRQLLLPGGTFICTLDNPQVRQTDVNGQLRLVRKYPHLLSPTVLHTG